MKKTLLTLFTLVFAMFTASAQTNLLENGDFETWAEGAPVNWKSTNSASSATLAQSTDAHAGASSVLVKGASGNKRLAYKEINLKAGDYTIKFYTKAATAEGGSARPGYVSSKADGTLDSNGYKYGDYFNDLTQDKWVEVVYDFTLAATTKVNLLVMNPKKPGKDILVDDYSLTTTNGGIAEGGEVKPEPQPEPSEEVVFSADFAKDMCGFTIEDKKLTGNLKEVWKHDASYKQMKGTATLKENGKFVKYEAESWAISPVIDLTKVKGATLSFTSIANFFNNVEGFTAACAVKVKAEGETAWTNVVVEGLPDGKSWAKANSTADLKAFDGKKIQLAFVYTSTTTVAGTWEFTNVKVASKGGEVKPDPQPQPETVYTTIAELKKNAGTVQGTVVFDFKELTVIAKVFNDLYVSDGKEATLLYGSKNDFKVGDKISGKAKGALDSWNGLTEMKNLDYTEVKVVSQGNTVTPLVLTLADLAAADAFAKYESMLVTVKGVKVAATAFAGKNISMVDGATKVTLRDNWNQAADFVFDTNTAYDFTGVVGQYNKKAQINLLSKESIQVSTGIEGVEAENGEQVIYDLSGRRVAKAVKGLYIINGKKVFVK